MCRRLKQVFSRRSCNHNHTQTHNCTVQTHKGYMLHANRWMSFQCWMAENQSGGSSFNKRRSG